MYTGGWWGGLGGSKGKPPVTYLFALSFQLCAPLCPTLLLVSLPWSKPLQSSPTTCFVNKTHPIKKGQNYCSTRGLSASQSQPHTPPTSPPPPTAGWWWWCWWWWAETWPGLMIGVRVPSPSSAGSPLQSSSPPPVPQWWAVPHGRPLQRVWVQSLNRIDWGGDKG